MAVDGFVLSPSCFSDYAVRLVVWSVGMPVDVMMWGRAIYIANGWVLAILVFGSTDFLYLIFAAFLYFVRFASSVIWS